MSDTHGMMMKRTQQITICLLVICFSLPTLGDTPAFDRYKVILERKPFGDAPPPPPVKPPNPNQSFARTLKLTALLEIGDGDVRVGIFESSKKQDFFISVGDTIEGIELVSADLDKEEVVLRKGEEMAVLKINDDKFEALGPDQQKERLQTTEDKRKKKRLSYRERRKKRQQRLKEMRERKKKQAQVKPKYTGKELEQHLQEYQMEVIRQGLPPLPIPLTEDMDNTLVEEGHLPPMDESGEEILEDDIDP